MKELCQRDDGLYRHSPLCEAAWGRGNGFAALGMALVLEDLPARHPQRAALLAAHVAHLKALAACQDYTGMWHQVVDRPESYREYTGTAMIAFAMARGIRGGWLDKKTLQPSVDRAWQSLRLRTLPGPVFVDVCTGTGKQPTLRHYYDREAITGKDMRAVSMLLLLAAERELAR
jgi:rhamnogalacturonyl hydrolase YesR